MLLGDISDNQYRVRSILTILNNAEDAQDVKTTLEALIHEELLSEEQFEKIGDIEESFDLPALAL